MGSLKAALKAFFPNNNGDTNFSSSCLVPYFDSSQNPKGCVTTSKLASVLGAAGNFVVRKLGQNESLDAASVFSKNGLYMGSDGGSYTFEINNNCTIIKKNSDVEVLTKK